MCMHSMSMHGNSDDNDDGDGAGDDDDDDNGDDGHCNVFCNVKRTQLILRAPSRIKGNVPRGADAPLRETLLGHIMAMGHIMAIHCYHVISHSTIWCH